MRKIKINKIYNIRKSFMKLIKLKIAKMKNDKDY